VSMVLEAEEQL